MSLGVRDQLRNYGSHFEAGLADFDVEHVTAPRAQRLTVRPLARPRRPWLVVAAAAVVVVLAIGGFALLIFGDGSGGEVIDEPTTVTTAPAEPTTVPTSEPPPATTLPPATTSPETTLPPSTGVPQTTAPSATTIPEPPPTTAGAAWQLVSDPTVFTENTGVRAVAGADEVVMVGGTGFEPWPWEATVWRSTDQGATWIRLGRGALGPGEIQSMAARGTTVVAVGNEVVDLAEDWTEDRHAVWVSTDAGLTWDRAPFDEAVFGAGLIWRVTAGGPGFLATGRQCVGPLDAEGSAVGLLGDCSVEEFVVWSSTDGLVWDRLWSEVVPGAILYDIQDFGTGLIIAGSWFDSDASFGAAVIWLSEDGTSWTRHELPVEGPGTRHSLVTGVEPGGPGLVAVGWEGGEEQIAHIWTSADGVTWTPVGDLPGREQVSLSTLARVGTRLIAAGGYLGQVSPVAWWSDDATTWTVADVGGEGSIWAAAAAGQRAVAVGAAVWVSPPFD